MRANASTHRRVEPLLAEVAARAGVPPPGLKVAARPRTARIRAPRRGHGWVLIFPRRAARQHTDAQIRGTLAHELGHVAWAARTGQGRPPLRLLLHLLLRPFAGFAVMLALLVCARATTLSALDTVQASPWMLALLGLEVLGLLTLSVCALCWSLSAALRAGAVAEDGTAQAVVELGCDLYGARLLGPEATLASLRALAPYEDHSRLDDWLRRKGWHTHPSLTNRLQAVTCYNLRDDPWGAAARLTRHRPAPTFGRSHLPAPPRPTAGPTPPLSPTEGSR